MPGYISEVDYFGTSDLEFVEVAVPTGTDVSAYQLVFYQADGTVYKTVSLGSFSGTYGGQDVYTIDQSTPGFDSGGDSMGTFYADDAIALVDDSNQVLQFISWEGNTVNAIEGPANGSTSTNIGIQDESLQSDDGGNSYYAQSAANKGAVPACYAAGTLIDTPQGPRPIEHLRVGDQVWTADSGAQTIRWIWDGVETLEDVDQSAYPVLIRAGALASDLPKHDLIVSPHHRMLVGAAGQLTELFEGEAFAPAKSLTSLPRIRFVRGKSTIRWLHVACDAHEVIRAGGCLSESLYLGPMVLRNLPRREFLMLRAAYPDAPLDGSLNGPLARPSLTVRQAEQSITKTKRHAVAA